MDAELNLLDSARPFTRIVSAQKNSSVWRNKAINCTKSREIGQGYRYGRRGEPAARLDLGTCSSWFPDFQRTYILSETYISSHTIRESEVLAPRVKVLILVNGLLWDGKLEQG